MALQTIINIGLLVVLWTCIANLSQGLKCYSCSGFGPYPNTTCNGTIRNCDSQETFCNTYSIKGSGLRAYEFTRDCVSSEVCKPDYCKKLEDAYGSSKSNCKVKCCNTDLCNHDNTKSSACCEFISAATLLGPLFLLLVNLS